MKMTIEKTAMKTEKKKLLKKTFSSILFYKETF